MELNIQLSVYKDDIEGMMPFCNFMHALASELYNEGWLHNYVVPEFAAVHVVQIFPKIQDLLLPSISLN